MESEFIQATINLPKPQKLVYDRSRIPSSADFILRDSIMKKIPLGKSGKFALVDDRDYELVSKFRWYCNSKGYVCHDAHLGYLDGKKIKAHIKLHKLIMRTPRNMQIDHKNHNKLDCRRKNMRICTNAQNQHNRVAFGGSSKYKGVCWVNHLKKWCAQIKINNKSLHLGLFVDEIKAAKSFDKAATKYYGEFAYLNYPMRKSC